MNLSILSTFLTSLGNLQYRGSPLEFHENWCHESNTWLRGVKFCAYFQHLLPYLEKISIGGIRKTLPSGCQNRTLLRGMNEIVFILSTLHIMMLLCM